MIILYPTETLYALGVNAFSSEDLTQLFLLKGRDMDKAVSVLVRDVTDIEHWAYLDDKAKILANKFLPGPITLVLRVRDFVPRSLLSPEGTLGFRVSSDMIAQAIISDFITKHNSPLTCTSANLSNKPTLSTPTKILTQLGEKASLITKIYDDGPRQSLSSTVISVINNEIKILRSGAISNEEILSNF